MNFGTPFGKSLAGGGAAFPADAPGYLFNDGLGGLSWDAAATPEAAGADKQIQFNDVGTMGANENLTFDKSTNTLSISGNSYNILSIGTDSKNFFEGFIWAGSDTLTEYRYSTSKLQVISHNVIDTNSIGYGDTQAAVFSAKGTGSVAGISVYAQTSGAELATRSRNMIGALGYDATDAVIQNLFGARLLADTGDASGELIGIQATAQGMVIAPVTATVTSEIGVEAIHGGFAFDGTYTVLETYGIKISLNPAADVGAVETIGDNYGLYIDDHSVRPVTGSHYNLYSAGANSKNYFQGNVEIDGDLDVSTGFISISGSDNQVLFNDAGVIGGSSKFTFDVSPGVLIVKNALSSEANWSMSSIVSSGRITAMLESDANAAITKGINNVGNPAVFGGSAIGGTLFPYDTGVMGVATGHEVYELIPSILWWKDLIGGRFEALSPGNATTYSYAMSLYGIKVNAQGEEFSFPAITGERYYGGITGAYITASITSYISGNKKSCASMTGLSAVTGPGGVSGAVITMLGTTYGLYVQTGYGDYVTATGQDIYGIYNLMNLNQTHSSGQNGYGLYVEMMSGASCLTGSAYGVYIASIAGAATANYNIYSAGATSKNKFEGDVEIGGNLDVSTGFISISGSDNQVLFNDSGVIGGTNNFTYDNILGKLALSWSGATGESENREIFALSATRTDGGGIDHGGYSDELCALNITTEATTPDTTQYGIKITLSADGQGVGENEESKLYGIESHCGLNNCINPSACAGVFNTQVRDCTYGSNWNSALEVSANVSARFDDCTSDGQGLSVGCGMTAYSNNTLTASLLKGSRYVFDIGAIYGGVINLTEAAFITTEALLECVMLLMRLLLEHFMELKFVLQNYGFGRGPR